MVARGAKGNRWFVWAALSLMCAWSVLLPLQPSASHAGNSAGTAHLYQFDGFMAREAPENDLSRAVIFYSPSESGRLNEPVRLSGDIGAKFNGHSMFLRREESRPEALSASASPVGGYSAHTPGESSPPGFEREETIKWEWPSVFANFDEVPPTAAEADPADGGGLLYTTASSHPDGAYPMTTNDWAGWRDTASYPAPDEDVRNYFYLYLNSYNSSHMGFSTYGYLEIDGETAVRGNSLRYRVTGGINSGGNCGTPITTKRQYLDLLQAGEHPVCEGAVIGHPCLYFANTGPSWSPVPFPQAQGANRLSMYYRAPAELTNGEGGWGNRPEITMNVGPYNGVGGHWYHEVCNQGGGWTHVLIDAHPQHNNSWSSAADYPFPSSSLRDMGVDYFNGWYRWYVTFKPYEGIAAAPYDVWFDEVEFLTDPEPQNNETVCSPAVTWFPETRSFEIGFMDKYKNNAYAYATYELRYSFEPITNDDWDQATPARILADERFSIGARDDGKFAKYWPYYASVWAPFTLACEEDLDRLTPDTLIFFAVKDISQVGENGMQPVQDTGIGRWVVGGRDYSAYGDTFDYEGDQPALPLIKRIDFRVPKEPGRGSIRVTILPSEAAQAGAGWRLVGESVWRAGGDMETDLQAGAYTVEFKDVGGWRSPANLTVTVTADQTSQPSVTYLRDATTGLLLLLLPD